MNGTNAACCCTCCTTVTVDSTKSNEPTEMQLKGGGRLMCVQDTRTNSTLGQLGLVGFNRVIRVSTCRASRVRCEYAGSRVELKDTVRVNF